MELLAICGVALLGAVLTVALRQHRQDYAAAVGISVSVVVLYLAVKNLLPLTEEYRVIAASAEMDPSYLSAMLKTVGIAYLTVFSADACRDLGSASLGDKVELVGKIAVLVLILPYIRQFLSLVTGMLS